MGSGRKLEFRKITTSLLHVPQEHHIADWADVAPNNQALDLKERLRFYENY